MSLGTEVDLGPRHAVLDGESASPQKGAQQPHHFSAHVYCGQTAAWINMPLGTEVGLGPDHIIRWGPSSLLRGKRHSSSPTVRPMSIVAKRSRISATAELLLLVRIEIR